MYDNNYLLYQNVLPKFGEKISMDNNYEIYSNIIVYSYDFIRLYKYLRL